MKISIVQPNIHKGNRRWALRTYDDATRKTSYKSLHTENRLEAERILARETARSFGNTLADCPGFGEALKVFLRYTEMSKGYGKTLVNYASQLRPLVDFAMRKRIDALNGLTNADANEFVCNYIGRKPNTIRQKVKCCRIFFKWCIVNWKLKIDNPFSSVVMPHLKPTEKSFWKPEQVSAILDATDSREMRLLFSLMAYAGLRFFEAQKVCWNDFDGKFLKVVGKGNKFARLPVSHKLTDEILRFLDGSEQPKDGRIFTDKLTNTEANRAVKMACARSGIKFVGLANCHRFRHSFASNLIGAGASIVSVQRLMRHSSASITLNVYSHILKEDLNNDVDLI